MEDSRAFRIEQRLKLVTSHNTYRAFVHPRGKEAVTDAQCLAVFRKRGNGGGGGVGGGACLTLLACWPRTGRTHQIRAHFAHLGCPLAGDRRYSKGKNSRDGWGRLFLHSASVSVPLGGGDGGRGGAGAA